MRFERIGLSNWRSFRGQQEIQFVVDPDKPITLLLGPNGSGKTALLNAFTWALYGEFTAGFDKRDALVNLEAVRADPDAQAWVELSFSHDGDSFTIRRSTSARQQTRQVPSTLVVTKNGERGVEADVHQILPPALRDLFFLPAESVTTASVLTSGEATDAASFDVGTAIRSLLSGDVYDHASKNLREATASEALKFPKNYRDETVRAAQNAYEQAIAEVNAAQDRQDNLPLLLSEAREKAAKAKQQAEVYNPVKIQAWEEKRSGMQRAIADAEAQIAAADEIYQELSHGLQMHFSRCAVHTAVRRLDLADEAGIMPPRIHEQVIQKTLDKGRCALCGEDLTESGRERVQQLEALASEGRLAVRGLESRTRLRQFQKEEVKALSSVRTRVVRLADKLGVGAPPTDADMKLVGAVLRTCIDVAHSLRRQAVKDFEESEDKGPKADDENLIEKAMVAQRRVDLLESEKEAIGRKVDELERRAADLLADYDKKAQKSEEHAHKTRALGILQEAKRYFDEARKGLETYGRKDFEKAVNQTYSDLVGKPYEIRVADDFKMKVQVRGTEEELPPSQSEKVLLLIACLGAIARLAPHYDQIAKEGRQFEDTGGVVTARGTGYPVVLDAPTSPLDDEYEEDVVHALPQLLPQTIVPVSAKAVETWEHIEGSCGAVYVLEMTSDNSTDRVIAWKGKDYRYSVNEETAVPARTRIVRIS